MTDPVNERDAILDALTAVALDGSGADVAEVVYNLLSRYRPGWDACPDCGMEVVGGECSACDWPDGTAHAVDDVVDALHDSYGIPSNVARPVVERFAADGGQGGHDFAGEVRENTAAVVAEWMVGEAMFDNCPGVPR